MPNRILLRSLLLLLAAVAATAQACDAAEPCDPNQRFEGSVCAPEPSAAGAGGTHGSTGDVDAGGVAAVDAGADAGPDGSSADDAATGCTQALEDALGVACSAPAECGCAAPYCAVMPGQTEGYCTTQDCDPAVGDCPDGYQCFDLASVGVSGFPTFCVQQ